MERPLFIQDTHTRGQQNFRLPTFHSDATWPIFNTSACLPALMPNAERPGAGLEWPLGQIWGVPICENIIRNLGRSRVIAELGRYSRIWCFDLSLHIHTVHVLSSALSLYIQLTGRQGKEAAEENSKRRGQQRVRDTLTGVPQTNTLALTHRRYRIL